MPTLRSVLLLEDDRAISELLKYLLEAGQYRVFSATCRMEAMEIALRYPNGIDVIVSDILLGPERGPVIAASVRESSPQARLLLTSGYPLEALYAMNILQKHDLEDGKTEFVEKTSLPRTIVEVIDRMLGANCPVASALTGGAR
jgi:DNA-binding NtrC family response regulator